MNNLKNIMPFHKNRWSFFSKGQIFGTAVGILFTLGAVLFLYLDPPQSLFDPSAVLLIVCGLPADLIVDRVFGYKQDLLASGKFLEVVLPVNGILGFIAGDIIGRLFRFIKNK